MEQLKNTLFSLMLALSCISLWADDTDADDDDNQALNLSQNTAQNFIYSDPDPYCEDPYDSDCYAAYPAYTSYPAYTYGYAATYPYYRGYGRGYDRYRRYDRFDHHRRNDFRDRMDDHRDRGDHRDMMKHRK